MGTGRVGVCAMRTSGGPVAQRLEPTAHNGLVGGSSPPGPTTQFPGSLVTETLREKLALARPIRRLICAMRSLAVGI